MPRLSSFFFLCALAIPGLIGAVDYACYTGSSVYERVPKVCNKKIGSPRKIDNSTTENWFCSLTRVKEQGMNKKRLPVYVWGCATPNQCNADCEQPVGNKVPKCENFTKGETVSGAGVNFKQWCKPALNNQDNKAVKSTWLSGEPLPAELTLRLPFRRLANPEPN